MDLQDFLLISLPELIIIVEVFHLFVCSLYVRSHVHVCMVWVVYTGVHVHM